MSGGAPGGPIVGGESLGSGRLPTEGLPKISAAEALENIRMKAAKAAAEKKVGDAVATASEATVAESGKVTIRDVDNGMKSLVAGDPPDVKAIPLTVSTEQQKPVLESAKKIDAQVPTEATALEPNQQAVQPEPTTKPASGDTPDGQHITEPDTSARSVAELSTADTGTEHAVVPDAAQETRSTNPVQAADHSALPPLPLQAESAKLSTENKKQVEDTHAFIQEQIKGNERLRNLMKEDPYDEKVGLSKEQIENKIRDLKAELKEVGEHDWDESNKNKLKLEHGLQEVLDIAIGNEGQKELDALRKSKEDLTTPEGHAKEQAALDKIARGQDAQKVQDVREGIAKDPKLKELLAEVGIKSDSITTIDDVRNFENYLTRLENKKEANSNALTDSEKKLLPKAHAIVNKAERKIVDQDRANIDLKAPDAMAKLDANLLRMAATHKHDEGWFANLKKDVGKHLEKYSSAELKDKRNKARGFSESIKGLKEQLDKEHDPEKKKGIEISIANAEKLRGELRGAWRKDFATKWFVLLLIFGPAAGAILIALGYAKLLQQLGKAPQG